MNSNTPTQPADLLAPLLALVELGEKATPGPWEVRRQILGFSNIAVVGDPDGLCVNLHCERNAAAIAAAVNFIREHGRDLLESLAAHRGEAALWVNLEQLAAARHDIAQHRMSYVRAWNTDYPPEGATQPLYDHPPQAQAGDDEFGRRPIAWAVQSKAYGLCYSFSNEFIEAFPNAPVNYVVAQAGAGDIEAMVDCMARVVAEHSGEDFDTIGEFAQSILLDTQRAALLAALEVK